MATTMPKARAAMLEISPKILDAMTSAESPSDMLRALVQADRLELGLARAQERVARLCGLTARRARAVWAGEAQRLWADEATRIREAYAARLEREEELLEARREALRARLETLRTTRCES